MVCHFYIFSFNRGQFLKNLVDSIERNVLDYTITIVDDSSDDLETLLILNDLKLKYRIVTPFSIKKSLKYGNLYDNKNWAMQDARERGLEYVFLVPEDAQIVRPILELDMKRVSLFFKSIKNSFQCYPIFVEKVSYYSNIQKKLKHISGCNYFIKRSNESFARSNYTDFGIFSINRFFSLFEKFEKSEKESCEKATQKNLVVGYDSYPFSCSLPFNKYHRFKGNEKLTNIINTISQTGFYPYKNMSENKIKDLFNKSSKKLAFAEDWLDCPNVPNKNLWSFWGGFFNLEVYDDERRYLAYKLQDIKESNLEETKKHELMIEECEKYLENNNHDTSYSKNTSHSYY